MSAEQEMQGGYLCTDKPYKDAAGPADECGMYLSEYAFQRAGTRLVHAGRRAQHACLPSRLLRHDFFR